LSWAIADADLRRLIEQIHRDKGYSLAEARDLVILEWLAHGDPWPFIEANNAGHVCGVVVQNIIALMLTDGRLCVGRAKGGQAKPGTAWQSVVVAQIYERELATGGNSDGAFEATAETLGMGESAVRACVTNARKR
jgi:hypothetical protein